MAEDDPTVALNLRVKVSTVMAIEAAADARGGTMKQVITWALLDAGVDVAQVDLLDQRPEKMRKWGPKT